MMGMVESFNVSVAGAIILSELAVKESRWVFMIAVV